MGLAVEQDKIILKYAIEKEPIHQPVRLSKIQNGFGGNPRTYFICPFCNRRARKLYLKDRLFRCRECARLNYPSQQATKGMDLAILRMNCVLRKDFGYSDVPAPINAAGETPDKPKGMRWKTYEQKIEKLRKAQADYDRAAAGVMRWFGINF